MKIETYISSIEFKNTKNNRITLNCLIYLDQVDNYYLGYANVKLRAKYEKLEDFKKYIMKKVYIIYEYDYKSKEYLVTDIINK